jgi:hypothetical protein
VVNGWRRSGFDFGETTPQVFERENVVRVEGGLPDEHRLGFDDMKILSKEEKQNALNIW